MKQGTQRRYTGKTLKDGMGREGEGVQDGGHVYTRGWLISVYAKKHYNIVK